MFYPCQWTSLHNFNTCITFSLSCYSNAEVHKLQPQGTFIYNAFLFKINYNCMIPKTYCKLEQRKIIHYILRVLVSAPLIWLEAHTFLEMACFLWLVLVGDIILGNILYQHQQFTNSICFFFKLLLQMLTIKLCRYAVLYFFSLLLS